MSSRLDFIDISDRMIFPRLNDLGASSLGEDANTFGDTLAEVIQSCPQTHRLPFKREAIQELKVLLTHDDVSIEKITQSLIDIDPTAELDEPTGWGCYPSLRSFWSDVLCVFEADPEIRKNRSWLLRLLSRRSADHTAPPANITPGGYVLSKHVDLSDEDIEYRFEREKRRAVSFFISKEDAERAIHQVIIDNANGIDAWLETAREWDLGHFEGELPDCSAIVIESANRIPIMGQRVQVTIVNKNYNRQLYYIHTVRITR